jgi:hypothetical protein
MSTAPASHRIQRSGQDFPIAMPYGFPSFGRTAARSRSVRNGKPDYYERSCIVHPDPANERANGNRAKRADQGSADATEGTKRRWRSQGTNTSGS